MVCRSGVPPSGKPWQSCCRHLRVRRPDSPEQGKKHRVRHQAAAYAARRFEILCYELPGCSRQRAGANFKKPMVSVSSLLAGLSILAFLGSGCAGGSKSNSQIPAGLTPPAASATAARAAATQGPATAADAAVAAAVTFFGGVLVTDGPTCQKQTKPCVIHGVDPDSPDRGITAMELADPQGGAAMVVFGRQADDSWSFWFGTQQQVYHALVLPAQMRVCADGQGVNVRKAADEQAPSAGLLKDGATVTAENFVLTQPGSFAKPGPAGNGWYSVSAPTVGFIRADLLSVLSLPDCQLRDFLTKS
jgi:hypothetical protein